MVDIVKIPMANRDFWSQQDWLKCSQ